MKSELIELENKKDILLGLAFKDFARFVGAGRETCTGFHFGITISDEMQNNEKWFKSYELFKSFNACDSEYSSHLEKIMFFGRRLRRFDEIRKAGYSWYEFWSGSIKPDASLYLDHSSFITDILQAVCNFYELGIEVTTETLDDLPYDKLISLLLFYKDTDVVRTEYRRLAADIFVDLNEHVATKTVDEYIILEFGLMCVSIPSSIIDEINIYRHSKIIREYDTLLPHSVIKHLGVLDHRDSDMTELKGAFYRIK